MEELFSIFHASTPLMQHLLLGLELRNNMLDQIQNLPSAQEVFGVGIPGLEKLVLALLRDLAQ